MNVPIERTPRNTLIPMPNPIEKPLNSGNPEDEELRYRRPRSTIPSSSIMKNSHASTPTKSESSISTDTGSPPRPPEPSLPMRR